MLTDTIPGPVGGVKEYVLLTVMVPDMADMAAPVLLVTVKGLILIRSDVAVMV
jgi:hypothetical protein